jgi:15-cis-phytoene synthase
MLAAAAMTPDPQVAAKVAVLTRRLAALSARYEVSALHGTPALPFRAAWAVLAAAHIYGGIAREVAKRGPAAWERRVSTSAAAKLGGAARAWLEARSRARRWPGDASRDGLWTRPH